MLNPLGLSGEPTRPHWWHLRKQLPWKNRPIDRSFQGSCRIEFVNYVDMVYADEAAHSKEISQLWQQYYIKKCLPS